MEVRPCPWITYEASTDDEKQNYQFDHTKDVLQSQTPLQSKAMNEKCRCDTRQTYTPLVPATDLYIGGMEDILPEDN